jgi:hypothetical protein
MRRAVDASLKYTAVFYVEADSQEALEAAVEYFMKRLGGGLVGYSCGLQACFCRVEVKWGVYVEDGGSWLAVKTRTERAAYAAVKLLIEAYNWFGGKAIQVVKYEEHAL